MHQTRIVLAFLSAALLTTSPSALAGGSGSSDWHQSGERGSVSSASAASLAAAQSSASQTAQGGAGGSSDATGGTSSAQGGTATQTQQASNAGNAQSVATSYSYPRQTPMAMAGFVQPTIPCATARNAGASSPVVGLAFGFSGHDKECDLREDARLFYAFGQPELAVRLLCKDARKFGLKNCHYAAPQVALQQPPAKYVTPAELRQAMKRVTERVLTK